MCTGFEILPSIFGAAEVGAGLGAGIEALSVGSALGGVTGGVLTGGGAALGGLGAAAGAGALGAAELFGGASALAEGAGLSQGLTGGLTGGGVFGADAGLGFGFGGELGGGAALGATEAGLGAGALDWGFEPALDWGAAALGAGASPLSSLANFAKQAQPVMSTVSGIKGLMDAEEMKRMSRRAGRAADPWGNSGGRSLADAQLQELLRNPEAVAATDPAFKLRVMGAQRANAQYGQDSGAMSVAGANASTDWYNARLAQLSGLAGGGVAPGAGGGVMVQGLDNAFDASSAALGSLGYAAGSAGAGKGGMTPAQQQRLIQMAMGG